MSDISREAVAVALKQFALGVLSDYGVDADIPRNDPDFSDACFAEADAIWSVFTALEAQVAAADRLADELATALEACRPKSHHAACPQPEYPLSRCMCGCDQPALAAFRAAKGE